MLAFLDRIRRAFARSPLEATLAVAAVAVSLYVVVAPLLVSRYLPMTDLPFHAAFGATFAHYWDPAYHLREQFTLSPLSHPYMSVYGVIAAAMLVFPVGTAVKIAVAIHLLLVPAGLAVLFHGAKKSPLLGLLGLGMVWGNLTHWGFINYVGALGLFAMIIGLSLLLVDRPTRGRQVALALALVALYFTHIFRYPFGIAAVVGTGVVMYPATRRLRPLLLPLLVAVVIFAVWWKIRPPSLDGTVELGLHTGRIPKEWFDALTDGFKDDGLKDALLGYLDLCWGVAVVCLLHAAFRRWQGSRRFTAWDAGVTLVPLACAAVFFAMFLVLPMWIGTWFYVFPREATAAVVVALGACPDLPRAPWVRAALVAAMGVAGIVVSRQARIHYADFAQTSEELHAITRQIPMAPRLYYSIRDHSGTNRSVSPFSHLAAYVQAEKGGWLSWSFAIWNHSPVAYRARADPDAQLIPDHPPRWDPRQDKPFFDWMLIRSGSSPDGTFSRDKTIKRVDHIGRWWLYHRTPAP